MGKFDPSLLYDRDKTWFISDIHFGHENILKFETGYHNFASIEEHDKTIVANWFSLVDQDDTVFFLGDISMPRIKLSYIKELMKDLPGKIVWIWGNHDSHIDETWQKELRSVANIIEFTNYKEIFIKCKGPTGYPYGYDFLRKIVLFHYPIAEHNGVYHDTYHAYGHVHEKIYPIKNAYPVSACLTDYKPVKYEWLEQKISEHNERFNRFGQSNIQPVKSPLPRT